MRGFTLIEVLVTLGLILSLSLVVYVTFYARSSETILDGASEQIAGDVRLCRDIAVSRHVRCRMVFTAGSSVYTLQKLDPVSGIWSDLSGTEQALPLPSGTLVQDVSDLSGGTLLFDSLGSPFEGTGTGTALTGSGTGGVDHIVVGSSGTARTIGVTVAPGTGRVEISK